jgi:hypothetical protein
MADFGPLRQLIADTIDTAKEVGKKVSMKDITVLAKQHDPFRLDTPANHIKGKWLADRCEEYGWLAKPGHIRGLHYKLVIRGDVLKPDGTVYSNTDPDWEWLSEECAKAARWLGYIPFNMIIDKRDKSVPEVQQYRPADYEPQPYISTHVSVYIPEIPEIPTIDEVDDITPRAQVSLRVPQPYKLVMIGEKSELNDDLQPLIGRYEADLYLPTGEMSDTRIYELAAEAAADGRPMVVFYFADCDPAGWQMPISVGRKLQALKALQFPDLEFQVRRVGLTPDQVREHGLPSTPLKEKELRASKWRECMGIDQTEITALAELRPGALRRIAAEEMDQFYDRTLKRRLYSAESAWETEAQEILDDAVDADELEAIRLRFEEALAPLRVALAAADEALEPTREAARIAEAEIERLNEELELDVDDYAFPDVEVPEPVISEPTKAPLVNSADSFDKQCADLISSKAYEGDEEEAA